jgi:hypothetical protein
MDMGVLMLKIKNIPRPLSAEVTEQAGNVTTIRLVSLAWNTIYRRH